MRNSIWLLGAVVLSACGPAGILSGKVTVEGGSAAGIAVIVYGPQSAATVTADDGTFSIGSLPDGKYVVRATVREADVEEVNVATTLTQGKASPEPILAFRASVSKVTGKVVMADGSDAANLTVTATGVESQGVRTAADGSFTFEGLKTGAYLISVEAKDTLEGRVGVGVNASGATDAGELRLTPIGRFGGTVNYNAMPVPGVTVMVPGTNVSAVTDATGRFSFGAVPTGNQAVTARLGTSPFFRSATAMVTVLRGANPDIALALTDDPPKTGTVVGSVTFRGPRNPRDITVSAPGSGATTTPQLNGAYSLTLPVGSWDVIASAPQHPTRVIGRVTVNESQAQALPGAELSWYRPLWRSNTGTITAGPSTVSFGPFVDTVPWSLVTFTSTNARLALVNATTADFRILASGNTSGHRISKNGKYAAWFVNNTAFVYEIATAAFSTFAAQQNVSRVEFSSDESALFIQRVGPTLTRIKFATPGNPETFPSSGNAAAITLSTVDRWFVLDTGNDVRLVTPRNDVAAVFSQVSNFSATPTAWALTNCTTTNCELRVLGPTSETTSVRDVSVNPPVGTLVNFNNLGMDNRGDYPCFSTGTAAFCVRSSDGSHFALPAVPLNFRLNEAGDRVIYTYLSGANYLVREEPMPAMTSTTNLGTNLVGWNVGWLSPTRAFAYELSGSLRTLHLVKAGVDTLDADVGSQAVVVDPPLLVVPQSTTSRWRAYVGDGPVRSIDVATSFPVTGDSVRSLGTGPVTKYAAVSFDPVSSYILDENMAVVRQTAAGSTNSSQGALRSGSVEFMWLPRPPGNVHAFYVFNTNVQLEYFEPTVPVIPAFIGAIGVYSVLTLNEDARTLQLGSFGP